MINYAKAYVYPHRLRAKYLDDYIWDGCDEDADTS